MKKIALAILLALSACGDDRTYSPDAAHHAPDAAIDSPGHDAAPVGNGGCMGNLPNSRTITINTGDPIPPSIINELQDISVGDRRALFFRQYFPQCWQTPSGSSPTIVNNPGFATIPVWNIPASTSIARVPYEGGDIFQSLILEIYGDGSVDWSVNFGYRPSLAVDHTLFLASSTTVNNEPATWRFATIASTPGQELPDLGELDIQIMAANGNLYLGNIFTGWTR